MPFQLYRSKSRTLKLITSNDALSGSVDSLKNCRCFATVLQLKAITDTLIRANFGFSINQPSSNTTFNRKIGRKAKPKKAGKRKVFGSTRCAELLKSNATAKMRLRVRRVDLRSERPFKVVEV